MARRSCRSLRVVKNCDAVQATARILMRLRVAVNAVRPSDGSLRVLVVDACASWLITWRRRQSD